MTNPNLISILNGQRSRVAGQIQIRNLFEQECFPLVLRKSANQSITAYAKVNGRLTAVSGPFAETSSWDGLVEYIKDGDEDDAVTVVRTV